ncbi:unnamed protein product [Psylliodes chrysocephalus]|uniref:Uncharacterized protein n=1 Tax=Psylliodes chrysocephalus TaxID=3402493 RepID=A0A9P0DA87_9CUCU|nr:unnamed protein product [Psylliodes chrysocephala]
MASSDPNRDVEKTNNEPSIKENCEENILEKYIYDTVLINIFKSLDEHKEEIRKKEILTENNMSIYRNNHSLVIRKQDKVSGPEEIFDIDSKSIFDEKCPPDSYRQTFVSKSFRKAEFMVYIAIKYTVPIFDDSGQRLPQAAIDGDIERGTFLTKVIIILIFQLILLISFVSASVWIIPLQNLIKDNHTLFFSIWALDFVLFLMMNFWESARKKIPYNYIILIIFTLCSAYPLAYFNIYLNTPKLLLLSFAGTVVIFLLLGIISCIKCQCSPLSYRLQHRISILLTVFLSVFGIFAVIHYFSSGNIFIFYIFTCKFLPIQMFFTLELLQLILGTGGCHAMKTDEPVFAAIMIYVYIITMVVILLVLMQGPYR